jgi:hypothetical protein
MSGGLSFRLYVDNVLMSEYWLTEIDADVEEAAVDQAAMARVATEAGLSWRLEIFDPDTGRTARVGSSPDHMIEPEPVEGTRQLFHRAAQVLGFEP